MRIEIIKTHRLHHVESSSVDHISIAGGSTLLTAVVLAREDRSLGALNREERSTLSLRSCVDDDDDDDDRKSTGSSPSRYKRCVPIVFIQPLYRELLRVFVACAAVPLANSRGSSRFLATLACRVQSTD